MGFLQNLTGWHALIVLAVILLFFGAAKLPSLARSVGQSARILKDEVSADADTRADTRADTPAA
ncbi:Sec-independent protein translocase TatA [Plantibacter sp. PA-3-X8]|uniref:twin-arginine translocase TatA/TatE family subunit n=1 Tax=unclassified Plantibacter TaxID=2624265 RepID=UPI000F5FE8C5|nr:twin-arginine translocase TatA/TatE family subunit [Plantibacter sp. PA-3-X8]AZH84499.1 Sec-independent protein translocase TatA [Plantibacter sp. PA-3-X8]